MVASSGNALIELNSETDFVAKNADFQGLANKIAAAAAELPAGASVTDLLAAPLDGGKLLIGDKVDILLAIEAAKA